jgi:hypothetical protein
MVEVRYTLGMCRIYGREYHSAWTEVNPQVLLKIRGAKGWEIRGETIEETVEEVIEEVIDEVVELTTLTKKALQSLCDEQGLEYKAFDNKSTLVSLLSDEEE